jgi:sugar lactone lactonase YvrE
MKIKQILCGIALLLALGDACAQPAPPPQAGPDPSTLTQARIAQAGSAEPLYKLAAIYKESGDFERLAWTLQRLTALQPNNGDIKRALATTYALQGEKAKSYDVLLAMQKQGFGYDLSKDRNFDKVADTKVWTYLVDGLNTNLKPFGEGKVAFTLPNGDHLFESLAFDPKRKQFLVGSVREGTIQRADQNGTLHDFIKPDASNGLWSVYAMAVDPDGDALYVASTSSVFFKAFDKADFGKAGVFKFNLSTGKLAEKYLLTPDNEPRTLSSIAVGKGGQVFAADGLRGIIYRLDGGQLKPVLENPKLTSIRGLALSADGKTLYFADYVAGILGIDLAAGKGFDLDYDGAGLVLGGIDGLYWYEGTLVAIENGMSPRRIMRLHLSDDGRKVKHAIPVDVANPAFGLPTYGTIDGDGLYFVANSQKNNYGTYGTPKGDAKMEAVRIFRSNLRFAWDEGNAVPHVPVKIPPLLAAPRPKGMFGNVEGGAQQAPAK